MTIRRIGFQCVSFKIDRLEAYPLQLSKYDLSSNGSRNLPSLSLQYCVIVL
jgi:hypothetical protein